MPPSEIYPIQEFLNYLAFQKRYSKHTIISYQNDLTAFFDFITLQYNSIALDEISASVVRSWLASLKQDKAASKTVNRKISTLKSFFKYQLKINKVTFSPMASVTSLKVSRRLPSFIEQKDIDTLFKYVDFPKTWEGRTNALLLMLFYQTGIRLSELISLKESQIDKSNGSIKVLGKGNKERVIPVNNGLLREIDNYIAEKKVFFKVATGGHLLLNTKGKPLYPKYVYNIVKKYLGDVSTNERKSPHVLRHSFATHLTNNGADINAIKELLGHSSLASTQIYTHNSIEKLKEVHKLSHPKS
ncbi:MAG: tyrosine-type recombinase/integrase [Ginsengibacter sp.]